MSAVAVATSFGSGVSLAQTQAVVRGNPRTEPASAGTPGGGVGSWAAAQEDVTRGKRTEGFAYVRDAQHAAEAYQSRASLVSGGFLANENRASGFGDNRREGRIAEPREFERSAGAYRSATQAVAVYANRRFGEGQAIDAVA